MMTCSTTGNRASAERSNLCREPNKKLSAKKALPRVFYLALGTEETLGKQASLPRGKQKALGTEKNTRQRFLCQVQFFSLSAKKFLKITFLPPNFFYPQHKFIKNLCSKLTQFQLCLLYLKILLLNRYFFVYV
jgi:hypothetical protein